MISGTSSLPISVPSGLVAVQAVVRGRPESAAMVEPDAVVALVVGGEHLAAG